MNIEKFIKDDLKIKVKIDGGELKLNLEDIAIGLGFVEVIWNNTLKQDVIKVHTRNVKKYLKDVGLENDFENHSINEQYIDEWVFYMLCMKGRNNKAKEFQKWVAKDVLPSLRKNSFYIDKDNLNKEKFDELKCQFEKLKLTMFDVCEMGKISLGKASELLLGDKHELKHRFIKLGWLDYDKCQVVQRKFKASNGKVYELFVYNVSGTYDKGKVSQQLQVSLTNAGYIWLKDKIEKDSKWGVM